MNKNRIKNSILNKGENDDKIIFYVDMSNLDYYDYCPVEDSDGRFYFIIVVKNKNVKFYQSGEYPNVFSDEYITQALVFTSDMKKYEHIELHIINDYE